MGTKRSLDGSAPSVHPGGRPPALSPEHIAALHDIVMERAQATLQEIADELQRRCGVRVCAATILRALRSQEIVRLKPVRRVFTKSPAKGAKRYGYTAAHRREEDVSPYSTNLTDAEWDLVANLFEHAPGQRGTPVHYSRRELVNACVYDPLPVPCRRAVDWLAGAFVETRACMRGHVASFWCARSRWRTTAISQCRPTRGWFCSSCDVDYRGAAATPEAQPALLQDRPSRTCVRVRSRRRLNALSACQPRAFFLTALQPMLEPCQISSTLVA